MSEIFIKMDIFHGRKTPDEEIEDWGWQGPSIEGIDSFFYSSGDLSLSFLSNYYRTEAVAMTSWQQDGEKLVVNDGIEPNINSIRHELVCCVEDHEQSYYGDFGLFACHHEEIDIPMQLRLFKESVGSAGYQEIILKNVVFVKFTYGTYHVYFKSIFDCINARQLTGWNDGFEDISLEIPVTRETQSIIVNTQNEITNPTNFFEKFELTPMQ